MAVISKLDKLSELAREKSSDRRRALLREVTDLFFEAPAASETQIGRQFDEVLSAIASQTVEEARVELSQRFADADLAPRGLVQQLARDAISVAGPILERSKALSEEDLVRIIHETGQDHMRAISGRAQVPERVSHAIVERGDDQTVAKLITNEGAKLSRATYETVTQRAESSKVLQGPLVGRKETPPDLLNDLMLVVENSLREKIMSRFDRMDAGVLEAALAASRQRLESRLQEDTEIKAAREFIARAKVRKQLDGNLLAGLLREKKRAHFCVGFAEMAGIDYTAAKRALEHDSIDGLALICKAAGIEKALFVTLAVLRGGEAAQGFDDARELGKLYETLPMDGAERALRFWRMRKDVAA